MHAALTSVLCAIWLAIESNKTLTLRVEIFRREILLSKGIKNYEMFSYSCCKVRQVNCNVFKYGRLLCNGTIEMI